MPSKSKIRALRSASASVRPPPPSPLPGMDQSMGAKSIRPEDAAHMTIPAVGSAGAAGLAALTLLILWSMEQFSEWIARPTGGEAARECEQLVREVLDPFWTVAIAYAVFAIGAAVFLFLWRTYASAKTIPCWTWWSPQTVYDPQHPRSEEYDDLDRQGMLAVPRDSVEIENILDPEYDAENDEPIPELLILEQYAWSPCLGGPAGCWCPPFYPSKVLCWMVTVWLVAAALRTMLELAVRAELNC